MKRITTAAGFLAVLLMLSCVDETDAIRESVSLYWNAIVAGDFDAAYRMISRESRVRYERGDFEEAITLGKFTDDAKLHKVWAKEADFVIEDIKQRGKQARVYVDFHLPDVDGLRETLAMEAAEKNLERKVKGDSARIEEWYTKRMVEEIRKGRFDRTVVDVETQLIREAGIWRIVFNG